MESYFDRHWIKYNDWRKTKKIKKFYEDVCLLEQPFVIDNKIKIKDVISEFNKNNNLDLTIKNYFIFKLGL